MAQVNNAAHRATIAAATKAANKLARTVAKHQAAQAAAAPAAAPASAPAAAHASPLASMAATLVAAPVAVAPKPTTVALRGGVAVAYVAITPGAKYRTGAAHTQQRWALLQAAAAAHPQGHIAVAPLLAACTAGHAAGNYAGPGVPSHFITYCLRRGSLQVVAA
jgi:hypothetical protein